MTTHYRPDIDGLRAVAVLAVIAFHAGAGLAGGFVGVDVFFVISGFLITSIVAHGLDRGTFSIVEFYVRRVRRILPALVVVLLACWIAGALFFLPEEYAELGRHMAAAAVFISNFTLLRESGYFDAAGELKPLLHLWSLAIEEQFYLALPAALALFARRPSTRFRLLALIAAASFIHNVVRVKGHASAVFYMPHTRVWELLVGSLLAVGHVRIDAALARAHPQARNALSIAGIVLIAVAMLVLERKARFPGWWALLPTLGTAAVLAAGEAAWLNRRLLATRALVWVGLISYPLYLWHYPLLSFSRIVLGEEATVDVIALAVAAAFGLAWVTYLLVEQPIRGRNRPRAAERRTALALLGALIALGIAGRISVAEEGFPSRVPDVTALLSSMNSREPEPMRTSCQQRYGLPNGCSVADPDKPPTMLVIGDSHAEPYAWGLRSVLAGRANVMHFGDQGCVPLLGVESAPQGEMQWRDRCDALLRQAFEIALSSPSVDTVFLAARGPLYVTTQGFGYVERHDRYLRLRGRPRMLAASEIFRQGLEQTLQRFAGSGKRVIFILDNPELGFHPKDCILARPVPGHPRKVPCAIERARVEERNALYRRIVEETLARYPFAEVFDTFKYLCDTDRCYAMRGTSVLYMDDDHLSYDGARFIGSRIAEACLSSADKVPAAGPSTAPHRCRP